MVFRCLMKQQCIWRCKLPHWVFESTRGEFCSLKSL
ncbi:DUF3709 domain-containing protein [Vibrio paracholerae]|nr:DUF3709 domain-containing protein [Vibrio paracholerae]